MPRVPTARVALELRRSPGEPAGRSGQVLLPQRHRLDVHVGAAVVARERGGFDERLRRVARATPSTGRSRAPPRSRGRSRRRRRCAARPHVVPPLRALASGPGRSSGRARRAAPTGPRPTRPRDPPASNRDRARPAAAAGYDRRARPGATRSGTGRAPVPDGRAVPRAAGGAVRGTRRRARPAPTWPRDGPRCRHRSPCPMRGRVRRAPTSPERSRLGPRRGRCTRPRVGG